MTFMEDKKDAFLGLFEEIQDQIRSFDGCTHLELFEDYKKDHIFITYSFWEDEDALNSYRQSSFFKEVWQKTKSLFAEAPVAFSMKKRKGKKNAS